MTKKEGLADLMSKYVTSNLWANKRYVEWLKAQPEELMTRVVPSSFASIKETVVHIWDTERFWLSVVERTPPPPSFRMNGFDGTLEEAFSGIVEQSEAFEKYVHSLSREALCEDRILDSPWVKGAQPQYDFILQAMNHSTYHRGQIVTIGRNIGIEDAPMSDYNAYLMLPDG